MEESFTFVTMTNEEKSALYRECFNDAAVFVPFSARRSWAVGHIDIAFLGILDHTAEQNQIESTCKSEFRCNCCKQRAHYIGRVVDSFGGTFCSPKVCEAWKPKTAEQKQIGELTRARVKAAGTSKSLAPNWTLELVPPKNHIALSKSSGGFDHYHMVLAGMEGEPSEAGRISDAGDFKFYNKALAKYTPVVYAMLAGFTSYDWDALRKQLPILKRILGEVTYGSCALGSVKWFEEIIAAIPPEVNFMYAPLHTKMHIVGKSILQWVKQPCDITAEEREVMGDDVMRLYSEPIVTVFHQFNKNVLDLMQSAHGEAGMRGMVKKRFSPDEYQRPTAKPTEGKLNMSANVLGDYSFTISTIADIEKYPECIAIRSTNSSIDSSSGGGGAMSYMNSMQKKKSKYSFSNGDEKPKILEPNTLTELFELIRKGDVVSLEMRESQMGLLFDQKALSTCYIAETTLARPHCIAPYGWVYLNGETRRFKGIQKVTHIMPVCYGGKENYIFILANSKTCRKITSNIGWSEFLSASIRRVAGSTFEEVAKKMPVKYPDVPENMGLAIGVGTSKKDILGNLYNSIDVKINGMGKWIIIRRV